MSTSQVGTSSTVVRGPNSPLHDEARRTVHAHADRRLGQVELVEEVIFDAVHPAGAHVATLASVDEADAHTAQGEQPCRRRARRAGADDETIHEALLRGSPYPTRAALGLQPRTAPNRHWTCVS